jgi:uncharacterized membrane protein
MTVAEGIVPDTGAKARTAATINVRLAWLFLFYALPMVLVFSVAMAPLQVADEYAHFLRADQVSRGVVMQQLGGIVDGGVYAFGHLFEGFHFHPEVKEGANLATRAGEIGWVAPDHDENFQNTAQYGPLLYAPQILGIDIGRALSLSIARTLLLARLLNGALACAVGFLALRLCRRGLALTFTTLLLPMTLSQFGSASQDAMIVSLSILAVTIVSRVIDERRAASTWEFAIIALIAMATTMGRPSQIALGLLALPMLGWRDGSLWRKVLIGIAALVPAMIWLGLLTRLMPPTPPTWSVAKQFAHMISGPLVFPTVIADTFGGNWRAIVTSIIGVFGWLDTPMPTWFYEIAIACCLCALFAPGNRPPYLRPALWGVAALVGTLLTICAALYMSWSDVGAPTVGGLQGRYFLVILPLIAWLVPAYGPRLTRMLNPLWFVVTVFPLLSFGVVPWVIMDRYYGSWTVMGDALRALLLP